MIEELLDARGEYSRQLLRGERIRPIGIGVGIRTAGGHRQGELAVQVFVSTKVPVRMLSRHERIPGAIDGIPIDVIESMPASFSGGTGDSHLALRPLRVGRAKYRPLKAGVSCSNLYTNSGTLGAFCEGLNRHGRPAKFILGCGHVLRGGGTYKETRAVIQASPADGGTSRDIVAEFDRGMPLSADKDGSNLCDAAIAELVPGIECVDEIVGVGRINGKIAPALGMRVMKAGRTTAVTRGVVTTVGFETRISWNARDPRASYRFVDLVRIEPDTPGSPFSLPGDSGALVVSASHHSAAGLYFAGGDDGSFGLAAPIATVERALDVQLTGTS